MSRHKPLKDVFRSDEWRWAQRCHNPVTKTVVAEGLGFGEVTAGSDETIASQTEFPSRGATTLVVAPAQPPNQSQYRAGGNTEEKHAGGAGFHT